MRRNLVLWMFAMLLTVSVAWAQTRTVNGQVREAESGDPLFGVGVLEKGTVNGTLTDFDGRFTLTVPDGATLVITYVGYEPQEVIANSNDISVTMEMGLKLEAFIVTGYQEIPREQMTGSVATITPASLEKFSIASFDQVLQGKAPGLLVLGGSGQPGANAGRVQIRGQGSISGANAPIYIVDGIPLSYSNYSTLNSRDFEQISVLKDASSASLYGSRGANGVIVIKTRNGNPGQTAVNYGTSFGFSTFIEPNYGVMNSSEKLAFENYLASIGLAGVGPGGIYGPDGTAPDPAVYSFLESRNNNWKKELTQLGFTHQHNLSFSGGNEKTTFYISGNFVDQEGQIERSSLSRGGFRANIEHKVNDRFKLSSNSYVSYRKSSFIESEGAINTNNIYALMYLLNPYDSIFNPDGTYNFDFTFAINRNPLEAIRTRSNILKELRLIGNLRAEYELVDGLKVSNNVGIDMSSRNSSRYIDPRSQIGAEVQGGSGSIARDYAQTFAIVNTSALEYSKRFNLKHFLDLFAGMEIYRSQVESFGVTAYGLNPKIKTIAGTTSGSGTNGFIPTRRGGQSENMLIGGLLRGSYSYLNRYVISSGFRRDGSSKFGADNRFANFWNVGAAWNLHNENFLKDNKVINELRLTVSHGTLSSQEVLGDFPSLGTFTISSYNGIPGIAPANPEYRELKWEVLTTTNIGVDFALWKDRVVGTVNFYNNLTSDIFVTQELSRTTGFTSLSINAGEMINRGVEVLLDIDLVRTKNFLWNVYGNFTYNKNEVLDLGKAEEFESGTAIIKEGFPVGTHFEVGWAGVDPATGAPMYYDVDGNITFVYDAANRTPNHGTFDAPRFGGFGTAFNAKGFFAQLDATYQHGSRLYNNVTFFSENHGFPTSNQSTIMNTIWKNPGDITEVQSALFPREFSSKDIEDGSYLRLRKVTVGYDFSSNILKKNKYLKALAIYATVDNLYTFTKFTGFDPEVANNIEQFSYPAARTFTFGVDIGL